jgi:hypothetical protein
LLPAQRATTEIPAGYTTAPADAAWALIELEPAAGLADVEFRPVVIERFLERTGKSLNRRPDCRVFLKS